MKITKAQIQKMIKEELEALEEAERGRPGEFYADKSTTNVGMPSLRQQASAKQRAEDALKYAKDQFNLQDFKDFQKRIAAEKERHYAFLRTVLKDARAAIAKFIDYGVNHRVKKSVKNRNISLDSQYLPNYNNIVGSYEEVMKFAKLSKKDKRQFINGQLHKNALRAIPQFAGLMIDYVFNRGKNVEAYQTMMDVYMQGLVAIYSPDTKEADKKRLGLYILTAKKDLPQAQAIGRALKDAGDKATELFELYKKYESDRKEYSDQAEVDIDQETREMAKNLGIDPEGKSTSELQTMMAMSGQMYEDLTLTSEDLQEIIQQEYENVIKGK